jgi:hypothetical protein
MLPISPPSEPPQPRKQTPAVANTTGLLTSMPMPISSTS